ncbi:MAG TPA: type II secretion system F family protein [Myxococcales bacterium]|nr:type II secretion system F family protein [Myxococcales bacterium]
MTSSIGDVLQAMAALSAAAAASALAFAALALAGPSPQPRASLVLGLGALAKANDRWVNPSWLHRIDAWLLTAGRPRDLTAGETIALSEAGAAAGLGLGVASCLWLPLGIGASLAFAVAGALAPALWLRDRIRLRRRAISRALPCALDLLTLSVEAGLDFAAALSKVAERGRAGPLAHELSVVLRELRLGKTREDALRNLARRVELPVLTSFVQALVHADRMGTPLGKVLRILSTQLRVERTQRAEKLANQAPVKLLVPLVLCIFPTLFLMLFGPLAYQLFFEGTF